MSEELQKPAVIDIEAILQPISGESPSGENVRYAGVYDEILEARRADEIIDQGIWQTDYKTADYNRVIDLAVPTLTAQTKDMQIAAWLSEALVRQHGFAGLRDSLKLMAGLQERFWETVHPEIDEGDMEGRANAIAWMDAQAAFSIKKTPITSGSGYSFLDFEDSKVFNFPDDLASLDTEEQVRINSLKEQVEKENRVTADLWKKGVAATRRQFCEETNYAIVECSTALKDLNTVIEEKFDRNQMPGLGGLNRALDDVHTQVKKLLEQKRIEEPNESDFADEVSEEGADGTGTGRTGSGGPVSNRGEALRKLGEVAEYFQRTEPHSPVALLVQRAVRWGNMPLESWLRDVVKDNSVLEQIRETLGLSSGSDDSGGSYYAASSDSDSDSSEEQ